MKNLLFISLSCIVIPACRSSYDETKSKPEVRSSAEIQTNSPIMETPNIPPKTPAPVPSQPVAPTQPSAPATTTGEATAPTDPVGPNGLPLPVVDPAMIMTQHEGSPEELKKYNCKGTALITDTGMDDNQDGTLQYEEIQETRIDCTEVVPGR